MNLALKLSTIPANVLKLMEDPTVNYMYEELINFGTDINGQYKHNFQEFCSNVYWEYCKRNKPIENLEYSSVVEAIYKIHNLGE